MIERLGTPESKPGDAARLAGAMHDAGVDAEVERLLTEAIEKAWSVLDSGDLPAPARAGLKEAIRTAAWRDA